MKHSETMNSLIKPIVLFSSEIWGHELKPDCTTEKSLRDSANTSWGSAEHQ